MAAEHAEPVGYLPQGNLAKKNQAILGMSIFIGSEVMVFAAFFVAYFIARANAPQWPPKFAGLEFEVPKLITLVNTSFLVFSSFTVWWAEDRLKKGDRAGMIRGLALTLMLGLTFLIVQVNEYAHLGFTVQDKIFGTVFYTLTGLHGFHVLLGLTFIWFARNRAKVGEFRHGAAGPLVAASIYWHFVDVVWVFLFVVVYLV